MKEKNPLIIATGIFSVAFIIFALIISSAWRNHTKANQTITVTGSAKKDIVSDLGFLRGTLTARSTTALDAYRELESQKPSIYNYFAKYGFSKDQIKFYPAYNNPIFDLVEGRQTNNVIAYQYSQRLEIQSNDVKKIAEISLDIASLIEKGVNFEVEQPEYYYTKIAQVKIEIQAEAAKDAMTRAIRIAESTDSDIGPLKNARMGVLQITPKNSNEISDYGMNDVSSIEKEITAVVNASFEIR
jgi:hypothetical protein